MHYWTHCFRGYFKTVVSVHGRQYVRRSMLTIFLVSCIFYDAQSVLTSSYVDWWWTVKKPLETSWMKRLMSFDRSGSSSEKHSSSSHFFSSEPATYTAELSSHAIQGFLHNAPFNHCVPSSKAISPQKLCARLNIPSSVDSKNAPANRAKRFLNAEKTSSAFMKAFAPVDCR